MLKFHDMEMFDVHSIRRNVYLVDLVCLALKSYNETPQCARFSFGGEVYNIEHWDFQPEFLCSCREGEQLSSHNTTPSFVKIGAFYYSLLNTKSGGTGAWFQLPWLLGFGSGGLWRHLKHLKHKTDCPAFYTWRPEHPPSHSYMPSTPY